MLFAFINLDFLTIEPNSSLSDIPFLSDILLGNRPKGSSHIKFPQLAPLRSLKSLAALTAVGLILLNAIAIIKTTDAMKNLVPIPLLLSGLTVVKVLFIVTKIAAGGDYFVSYLL